MTTPNQSFGKVLEQYVFEVASAFIDSADQETQSGFIQLISQINTTSDKVGHHAELLAGEETESEWQQVLNAPVDWLSVDSHRLINQLRQRISRNELFMTHLEKAILTTEQRYQRTQNTIVSEPHRSSLLDRHRKTQICFQQQLELAQRAQQSYLKQLSQVEQSEVKRKTCR